MAENKAFGYQVSAGSIGQVATSQGRKSTTADNIKSLFASIGNIQKTQAKQDFNKVSNEYRERKTQYQQGLDQVRHDPAAFEQHLSNFKADVEDMGNRLDDDTRNTFMNSAGNFAMYQESDLNSAQLQYKKRYFEESVGNIGHMYTTADPEHKATIMDNLITDGKAIGISPEKVRSKLMGLSYNEKIISLTSEETTYEQLLVAESEAYDELKADPKLKGKRYHSEYMKNISMLKKQFEVQATGEFRLAKAGKDPKDFDRELSSMKEMGLLKGDALKMEENQWYAKQLTPESKELAIIEANYTASPNMITDLSSISHMTAKGRALLKSITEKKVVDSLLEASGEKGLIQLQRNIAVNPKVSKGAIKESIEKVTPGLLATLSNPKADAEEVNNAIRAIGSFAAVSTNVGQAMDSKTKLNVAILTTIAGMTDVDQRVEAIANYNKKGEVELVSITEVKDLVGEIEGVDNKEIQATYSTLALTSSPEEAAKKTKEIFAPVEVGNSTFSHELKGSLPQFTKDGDDKVFLGLWIEEAKASGLDETSKQRLANMLTAGGLLAEDVQITSLSGTMTKVTNGVSTVHLKTSILDKASKAFTDKRKAEIEEKEGYTNTIQKYMDDLSVGFGKTTGELRKGAGGTLGTIRDIIEAPGKLIGAMEETISTNIKAQYNEWYKSFNKKIGAPMKGQPPVMPVKQPTVMEQRIAKGEEVQSRLRATQLKQNLAAQIGIPEKSVSTLVQLESGNKGYTAQNPKSSAYGKYQFMTGGRESTGYAYARDMGYTGKPGAELRKWMTPERQDAMFVAFTKDNVYALKKSGLPTDAFHIYAAHQQGISGLKQILSGNITPTVEKNMLANLPSKYKHLRGYELRYEWVEYWVDKTNK